MKTLWKSAFVLAVLVVVCSGSTAAAEGEETGKVELPLEDYQRLLDLARDPTRPPRPAPASYALGSANVRVQVSRTEPRASAHLLVQLAIDVLEDEWVLIPVLPSGTPVEKAMVSGKSVQLLSTPVGLAWSTNKAGSYTMNLTYNVDATRSGSGFALPVPLPRAAAINLTATLPGTGLDVSVIPSAGSKSVVRNDSTQITATIPSTTGVQISWRTPSKRDYSISRAEYRGRLVGNAVTWTAELEVVLFNDRNTDLPLFPRSVTLSEVTVDGKPGPVLAEGDHFTTLVSGRGTHKVLVGFQVNVVPGSGPPRVDLDMPAIPISRFDLALPGRKELVVTPASNVTVRNDDGSTLATVHVPMTRRVSFTWSEAIPEDVKADVRANAAIYHAVHAEEGVLFTRATVDYAIRRGETNVVKITAPVDVQINEISSPSGIVADWRVGEPHDGRRLISLFLDRRLESELRFDVHYDRSLAGIGEQQDFEIPLLRAVDAQRQRGMIALLSSRELTLSPVGETGATKVGENQLPAAVREQIEMTVAHTYKYTETLPDVKVRVSVPERIEGKFDAQVDTLISLGDVTMTGSATLAVNVKSGTITQLSVGLPADVNLLSLTAPSLRTHRIIDDAGGPHVRLEFTQEMEGRFRVEMVYERILGDDEDDLAVPTVTVRGAEVEQGRIAVEALTAVEVQPASTEHLSPLDINELPRQLVLRTTNPILLAFKYVHADPPHRLSLLVTRHPVLGVQEASIDRAHYRTLFTSDGLWVTTADFTVRNSRKQFLRVELPRNSEVWSAFVDGRPERPAIAGGEAGGVLIKIINSTEGFPVQLIFATRGPRILGLGDVEGVLPRPDVLVTRSSWDVYVPGHMRYGKPSTNTNLVRTGRAVSGDELGAEFAPVEDNGVATGAMGPLRITVPTSGIHFAFEKLYANQSDRETWVRIPYASRVGAVLGQAVGLLGTLLLWTGIAVRALRPTAISGRMASGVSAAGFLIMVVATGVYHVSPVLPLIVSAFAAVVTLALYASRRFRSWEEAPGI